MDKNNTSSPPHNENIMNPVSSDPSNLANDKSDESDQTIDPHVGPNNIYVGVKSKWYKEYLHSGSNMQNYIVKTINRIIDYHDKYLNVVKNNGQNVPNIFTAGLVCDCAENHEDPNLICHRDIIIEILRDLSHIRALYDPLTMKLNSLRRKKILTDRIFVGKKKDDPFVVEGTLLNNRYRIVRCLAQGSYGCLFFGTDIAANFSRRSDFVVIKISRSDSDSIAILNIEHRCLVKLNKKKNTDETSAQDNDVYFPKVLSMFSIPSHSWGTHEYHQVMVLERYGKDLYESVLSRKPNPNGSIGLKLSHVQTIFKQLAKTIKVVHDADIIHKDIKCENILLRRVGQDMTQEKFDIVLIDYGMAIDIETAKRYPDIPNDNAKFSHLCGTVAYMSPEEILGREYGKSVDIFNIGLIIVEMYRGRYVFPNDAAHILNAYKRIFADFPDKEYNPSLITPKEYDRVINNIPKNKYESLEHDTVNTPYQKDYFTHDISDPDLTDLLNRCLDPDPGKRISASNILAHPFIMKTIV